LVDNSGVVEVAKDTSISLRVSTGEGSRGTRAHTARTTGDLKLDASGVVLSTTLGLTILESDDFIAKEITAVGETIGEGDGSGGAGVEVLLCPCTGSSGCLLTILANLEPFRRRGGGKRGAVSFALGHVPEDWSGVMEPVNTGRTLPSDGDVAAGLSGCSGLHAGGFDTTCHIRGSGIEDRSTVIRVVVDRSNGRCGNVGCSAARASVLDTIDSAAVGETMGSSESAERENRK